MTKKITLSLGIDFILRWKKLFIASALLGCLIGGVYWNYFLEYQGNILVVNHAIGLKKSSTSVGDYGFLSDDSLQAIRGSAEQYAIEAAPFTVIRRQFPEIARRKLAHQKDLTAPEIEAYNLLSHESWWVEHLFFINKSGKAETRDYQDKDGIVLGFRIKENGRNKESLISQLSLTADFIKKSGAYLDLTALLSRYEIQNILLDGELRHDLSILNMQLNSLKLASKNGVQYDNVTHTRNREIMNSTEIEIDKCKIKIDRIIAKLAQIQVLQEIVRRLLADTSQTFDGILLSKRFMDQIALAGQSSGKDSAFESDLLGLLNYEILSINLRYSKGLEVSGQPSIVRLSLAKSMLIGLVIGLIGALLIALVSPLPLFSNWKLRKN
jgi:hypothetical protein